MGRAKAPVFPEPVSAKPITSFPDVQEQSTKTQTHLLKDNFDVFVQYFSCSNFQMETFLTNLFNRNVMTC